MIKQFLVPGTPLSATDQDDRIPILLIQTTRSAERVTSPSSGAAAHDSKNPTISGWTVLVPSGWSLAFWHSLVYADTRVGGIRERDQQFYEAGAPIFPMDYPSPSNRAWMETIRKQAREEKDKWDRKPPAKRINYTKLGTHHPWDPDFSGLVRRKASRESQDSTGSTDIGNKIAALSASILTSSKAEKGKRDAPWLLQGNLLAKVMEAVEKALQKQSDLAGNDASLVTQLESIANAHIKATVQSYASKRGLGAELGWRADEQGLQLSHALVKVSLRPIERGHPKYNAVVYRIPDGDIKIVREHAAEANKAEATETSLRTADTRKRKRSAFKKAEEERMLVDNESFVEDTEEVSDSESIDPDEGEEKVSTDLPYYFALSPKLSLTSATCV